jgi:hypothetical protein
MLADPNASANPFATGVVHVPGDAALLARTLTSHAIDRNQLSLLRAH